MSNSNEGALIVAGCSFDWITPRIAVGSAPWTDVDRLRVTAAGITHVIDCRGTGDERLWRGSDVDYWHHGTHDEGGTQPDAWILRGVQIARQCLRDPNARLLVHCAAGVHRSPSLAYAILRADGESPDAAEAAIVAARPVARVRYRACVERALGLP